MKFRFSLLITLFFAFIVSFSVNAQDPSRFQQQVDELARKEYQFSPDKKRVVFAGSSSIRMWKDVADYFPGYNVINNGFGGSHFSDLLYYYHQLIVKPAPDILFIYEGDNDVAGHKKTGVILKQVRELTRKIQNDLPETRIVYISPKPCFARESLKKEYMKLNKKLEKFCLRNDNVWFVDVWKPMHDEAGNLYDDIFLDDRLHMNKKGYDIWGKVINDFLAQ